MAEQELVLAPLQDVPRQLELKEAVSRRVLAPARLIGEELEVAGLAPIPDGPLVQQTPHGTWFFAADYLNDPGLRQDRAIAIPDRELTRLHQLRDAGVSVDLIWIAHELPEHWRPDVPLPLVVPDAPRYRQLDQSLEKFVIGAAQLTFKAARGIAIATAAAGALGVGLVGGIATAGVGVDPVILGGIRHPSEPIAFWVVLAQWEWE